MLIDINFLSNAKLIESQVVIYNYFCHVKDGFLAQAVESAENAEKLKQRKRKKAKAKGEKY